MNIIGWNKIDRYLYIIADIILNYIYNYCMDIFYSKIYSNLGIYRIKFLFCLWFKEIMGKPFKY